MSTKEYARWKLRIKEKLREAKEKQAKCSAHEWKTVFGFGCPGFKPVSIVVCKKCNKLKKEFDVDGKDGKH